MADMYEKKLNFEMAYECFFNACDLDDTDVFEMHRWGRIALEQKQLSLAHDCFVKVIQQFSHFLSSGGK